MSCQSVWVTVNCPATQTIQSKKVGLSNVQSNILFRLPLVCLYWGCYDHFQEMTSGIRLDSQEMDFPALIFFPIILRIGPTDRFLYDAGVWCERICHAGVLLLVLNFQTDSGWTLIRLAVSHSLEISYAVWACLYCSVIFGEIIMEAQP